MIAVGAVGAALLLVTLIDVFVTIFNYDGFSFLAGRLHRLTWQALRGSSRLLPARLRDGYLSLGSGLMLPMTLAWWLALEITAFALMYLPGMTGDSFALRHAGRDIGSAFYYSGGVISSLAPADIVPRGNLYRALSDVETIVGLATFTLALTYVLAAFDALHTLNTLHGRVRRHAIEPRKPESIIARYYHGGSPTELSGLLASLTEDLESYDQGLRRFPVVFYIHSRRRERSIPTVFGALGDLVELLRWGLPEGEPPSTEPDLLALAYQFSVAVDRLERSFVGDADPSAEEPVAEAEFAAQHEADAPDDRYVAAFRRLQETAREAAGLSDRGEQRYQRYREWLPFHYRRTVFLRRVRGVLGYDDQAAG